MLALVNGKKMNPLIVIIGVGQLGNVFAGAFLSVGSPVYPILRGMRIDEAASEISNPQFILVAVAEKDLEAVLTQIPSQWSGKVCLIQNELLPYIWKSHHIQDPTVISVWFEKKKGKTPSVLLPSPIYGPQAAFIANALEQIDIPCTLLANENQLLSELITKNVFVFTINIFGLKIDCTVADAWQKHGSVTRQIAKEIIQVQEKLTGVTFSCQVIFDKIQAAINNVPDHKCRGRSAEGRLRRVVALAQDLKLDIPEIQKIHREMIVNGNGK
jgi:ketopantoate reductase